MKKLFSTAAAVVLTFAMAALPAVAASADDGVTTDTVATETVAPAAVVDDTTTTATEPETEAVDPSTLTEPAAVSSQRIAPAATNNAKPTDEPSADKCSAGYLKPAPLDASSGNYTLMDGSTVIGTLVWAGDTVSYDLEEGWTLDLCVKSGSKSNPNGSSDKVTYFTGLTDAGSATILQAISHLEYKASFTPTDPGCDDLALTGGRGLSVSTDTVDCPEDPIALTAGSETLTDQVCVPSGDETPGTYTGGSIELTLSDYQGVASISYRLNGGSSVVVPVTGNSIVLQGLEPGTYDFVVTPQAGYTLADGALTETVKKDNSTECTKVSLCHWTNGGQWQFLTISKAAVLTKGHSLPAATDHGFDIIPPFDGYTGKNWDGSSDNSPAAFASYPFNGQQGKVIFPDCDVPDEQDDTDVSIISGSTDEKCSLIEQFEVVGGTVTLQIIVGGNPVTLANSAAIVAISVKAPGAAGFTPITSLTMTNLPDGVYEFQVDVAAGYDRTSPVTFSEDVLNKKAEECDLTTLGPIVPEVSFKDPTCTTDGSYTLVSPAAHDGLPAKTVTWYVNDVETDAGTYPVTAPASVTVKVVASPGYNFPDFNQEMTYPAHKFALVANCDLTTLALTGDDVRPTLALIAFLGLLGVAMLRSGTRIARTRQEA